MNVAQLIPRIVKPYLPQIVMDWIEKQTQLHDLAEWKKAGQPMPPPHIIKQNIITAYQQQSGYQVLVETGTFMGAMIEAQKKRFKKIFSIELSHQLHQKAIKRFKNDSHIKLVEGDSGKMLSKVITEVSEPSIFWLDGHYSMGITARGEKDCPIFGELNAIFQNNSYDHILLIDDARCFTGEGDYPTIESLTAYIQSKKPDYQLQVKDDVIRYTI